MKTVLLILPFLVSTALGRIGETLEQCRTRYGKEVATAEDGTTFKKGPFTVVITYWKNKAISVAYSRANGPEITRNEATVLLDLNAPGTTWLSGGGGKIETWRTPTGNLSAMTVDGTLQVTDATARQQMIEARRQEELDKVRATLEGL